MTVFALAAGLLLSGCKEPQGQPANGFVTSSKDVKVLSVTTYTAPDNSSGNGDIYYVAKITFTNHLGYDVVPQIAHFVLEDTEKTRFMGQDSGSVTLIGISNYKGVVKRDESHDYTVGFRVPLNTIGTVFYDPTT